MLREGKQTNKNKTRNRRKSKTQSHRAWIRDTPVTSDKARLTALLKTKEPKAGSSPLPHTNRALKGLQAEAGKDRGGEREEGTEKGWREEAQDREGGRGRTEEEWKERKGQRRNGGRKHRKGKDGGRKGRKRWREFGFWEVRA